MPTISLRSANAADAAAIAELHAASWRDAYAGILDPEYLTNDVGNDRLALWNSRFARASANQLVLLAEAAAGQVVGFVCAYLEHDTTWGTLVDNLHVHPSVRRQGIGRTMMCALVARLIEREVALNLHLWVYEKNHRALAFYHGLGGEVVEQDIADMPAAQGNTVLRVYWPSLAMLLT